MLNKFTITIFFLIILVISFCSQKTPNNCQINFHNIQLFINPEAHSLTVIDSIGIDYNESTDHIYFLLHDSLELEKIEVGYLAFEFSKLDKGNKDTNKVVGDTEIKDASLYKVKIPFNLSPNSMRIYYSGYIWEPEKNQVLDQFGDFLLTSDRVILKKDSCWYPTIPDTRSSFAVSTCSPLDISLHCNAPHDFQQIDGDFIINRWIFSEPVDGISLFTIGG